MININLEKVGKTFEPNSKHPLEAIKEVTFETKPSEFIAIIGPSGCGKTTLLRIIAGLEKTSVGRIVYNNKKQIDFAFSYVFQSPVLLPWRNAIKNIRLPLEIHKKGFNNRAGINRKAREWLVKVGLSEFGHYLPHRLSEGMRQRVSLARAFINSPKLILLDEPFRSLDMVTKEEMHVLFINLRQECKPSILFVTHDIEEAIFLADRIIVLSGSPSVILADIRNEFPQPRNREIRYSSEFAGLFHLIEKQLKKEN